MFQLAKFTINKVTDEKEYGKFEIGPLPSGYGITLGNVLRRILLSSTPGAAVTSVKIDGVKHEYSTISGVSDDVLQLLMKIKTIPFILHSKEPQVVTLSVSGKKNVTAKDFDLPSDVEIADSDLELTDLTKTKSKLKLEITVERSIGYELPEEDKRKELGLIPVDADYNPVKQVVTSVEKTRVGQETNLDKIILDVYTNGSLSPWDSLAYAVRHFLTLAQRMMDVFDNDLDTDFLDEVADSSEEPTSEASDEMSLDKLNLSTRLFNALDRSGYKNLMELQGKSKRDIEEIPRMGEKSAGELFDMLKKYKIEISEEE